MNTQARMTTDIDVDEFRKIVRSRRSVRRFTDEPIPDAILDECLDLAMLAPNSSNLQPWEFRVVRTPALRDRVAHACLGQNAAKTAPVLIGIVARTGTWRDHSRRAVDEWPGESVPPIVEKYYRKIAPLHYSQGPLGAFGLAKKMLGAVTGLRKPVPRGPYSPCAMRVWAAKSTALAAENLMLALRAHGFDSCPMEGFDAWRINRLLDVPDDGDVIMMLAAGRCGEKGIYSQQYRFNRNEFVHYL
ncbi:nitroreductase [Tamilnaduibacter salinus]|uniref:Nitroreductase n=1 Tax=Tamilnaduibacter salinus TaxID=1484056 RepID=A0A2A2HZY5_9GAMM|nr:nitroreductase family protein [Tamilnaduibacter salinus]PAV24957.1 nitroreductase family protein [Tamilnaduibacter salinus]PVY76802.1 nitroreductase [Tamilnaduibacter salinus]